MCSLRKAIKGAIIQWQQDTQSGSFQWEANVFTAACLPNSFRLSQAIKFGSLAGGRQWASVWYTMGWAGETYADQSWILFYKTMTSVYYLSLSTCDLKIWLNKSLFTLSDPFEAFIIFSIRHEIRRIDLHKHDYSLLVPGLRNTIALDFHFNNSLLYWTDVVEDKIYRGKLSDTGGTCLVPQTEWNTFVSTDLIFWPKL